MTLTPGNPVLSVHGLAIGFPGRNGFVPLVENICFTLAPGKILGIAGESGSGKTLTACAIAGLLPPPLTIGRGNLCFAGHPAFHPQTGSPAFTGERISCCCSRAPAAPWIRGYAQVSRSRTP